MAERSGKRLWSENGRVQVWVVHGGFPKILKLVAFHVLKIIKFLRWREFHCLAAPPLASGIVIWLVETLQVILLSRDQSVLGKSCDHLVGGNCWKQGGRKCGFSIFSWARAC